MFLLKNKCIYNDVLFNKSIFIFLKACLEMKESK